MKKDLPTHGRRWAVFSAIWLLCTLFFVPVTMAQEPDAEPAANAPVTDEAPAPPALTGDFKAAIVIDAETGVVLMEYNADQRREPASMLKMMTELIVLEHVDEGDMALDDVVKVSAKASKMGGSQVYLAHGEEFTVEQLLMALSIHSANDAAVALAEHTAGSTNAFVDLMNMKARELGMTNTEFHSVHGLPPGWKQKPDITTARDLARLGQELIKHPKALEWASTKTAPFRNGEFTLYNPNKLVDTYRGLDGIKTGYTERAGFCVTASAIQKGQRLISVVMGCSTDQARATETTRLLAYGFNAFKQVTVIEKAGQRLAEPHKVGGGKQKTVELAYAEPLSVSVPRDREAHIVLDDRLPEEIPAPFAVGDEVGRLVVLLDGRELGSVPIVATEAVEKGNWFHRLFH